MTNQQESCPAADPVAFHTPQEFLDAITARYPCPVISGYERAYWLYQCREAVRWISGFINEEYRKEIATVLERELTSDCYEIIPLVRQESRVNIPLMRQKYPEQFKDLVSIKAPDAAKILGKKTLYLLAKEKLGSDAIQQYEYVTVGDVERIMPAVDAAEVIETQLKVTDWAVQEKE